MSIDFTIEDQIPEKPPRKVNRSTWLPVWEAARANPGKAILVNKDWTQTKSGKGPYEAAKSAANNIRIGGYTGAKTRNEFDALVTNKDGVIELRVWLRQPAN